MMSKNSPAYKLQYYEDDVVIYTYSGRHPKLPNRYKRCLRYLNGVKHVFNSYYTEEHAKTALRYATRPFSYNPEYNNDKAIFYCPKCCMYHITTTSNKKRYNL